MILNCFSIQKPIGDGKMLHGHGVIFPSGACCVEWLSQITSIVMYKSYQDVEVLHQNYIKRLNF
jgi:hypothetical protein